MAKFSYDKDYPFAAFITNLGKYNEGYLIGEWVKFPITAEKMKEVFKRIGIGQKDEFGCVYEEWFITDYDCYVDGLYDKLGEYENLDELNYLAAKLDDMDDWDFERFQAAMELGDDCNSVQEIINLTDNLDAFSVLSCIHNDYDLGWYWIEESGCYTTDNLGTLQNYIDYESFGRDIRLEEGGCFTSQGYVYNDGSSIHEYYESREDIPDEYRVMNFETEVA